jgi:solute carrier family 39 (zinc transporter), member 7
VSFLLLSFFDVFVFLLFSSLFFALFSVFLFCSNFFFLFSLSFPSMRASRYLAAALCVLVLAVSLVSAHSHTHGGGHSHESHDHGSHDHSGHSHGGHAHHDDHGGFEDSGHAGHEHGHAGHSHGHEHAHGNEEHADGRAAGFVGTPGAVGSGAENDWFASFLPQDAGTQAMLATFLISVIPIFGVYALPIDWSQKGGSTEAKPKPSKPSEGKDKKGSGAAASKAQGSPKPAVARIDTLKVLLGFAVGGLLGDVFLHLIPHALVPHSHDGEHGGHDHSHSHGSAEHDHSAATRIGLMILTGMLLFFLMEKVARMRAGGESGHAHSHSHSDAHEQNMSKVTGILNIIADSAHNFTDGMAIAAAFLAGRGLGYSTTVAVFFHEIPHEIGDYAILIKSGYTKTQAMCVQLLTAVAALSGTFLTLWAGEMVDNAGSIILPFAAGGFIYIALVNIIPELLSTDDSVKQLTLETVAMIIGVSSMVAIGWLEE